MDNHIYGLTKGQASPTTHCDRMTFAAEVLLEPRVRDPWGSDVDVMHTRVRYELEIAQTRDDRGTDRLQVTRERALPIMSKEDHWRPYGATLPAAIRNHFLKYARRTAWLETKVEPEGAVFQIHQDGSAGRTRPAFSAESTVLSTMAPADFPHLFALREELRSWRLLQLDPFGLRRPSPLLTEDAFLLPDGSNLAAVLYRIREESRDDVRPDGILPQIVAELASVISGVTNVKVARVDAAREYRVEVTFRNGFSFPTSVVSDGTLRVMHR